MSRTITVLLVLWLGGLSLVLSACGKHEASAQAAGGHVHKAPHDGFLVELGQEAAHLELVWDEATGRLQAYVLDGELDNFIRLTQPTVELGLNVGGGSRPLLLMATANPMTGETVGDTALFEAQADWLKSAKDFDGRVVSITVRGKSYTDVTFKFGPHDNHAHHSH